MGINLSLAKGIEEKDMLVCENEIISKTKF